MIDDRFLAENTAIQRPPLQFYFDFSSPYSYIASEWVEAVAARHGRRGRRQFAAALQRQIVHPL